jgi:hypothetical protein
VFLEKYSCVCHGLIFFRTNVLNWSLVLFSISNIVVFFKEMFFITRIMC